MVKQISNSLLHGCCSSLPISKTTAHLLLHLWATHHGAWLLKCTLKFCISILLNGLCILQLLNQLHLKFFHLHDFILLCCSHIVFIHDSLVLLLLHVVESTVLVLFYLYVGYMLLLLDDLILHSVLLLNLELHMSLLLIILLLDHLALFCLLFFAHKYGFLNFLLLVTTIPLHLIVLLCCHFLMLVQNLIVVDFL